MKKLLFFVWAVLAAVSCGGDDTTVLPDPPTPATGFVAVLPEGEQKITLFTNKADGEGLTHKLEFKFEPEGAAFNYESMVWDLTGYEDYISINQEDGTITALKAGDAEITLQLKDENGDIAKFDNGTEASLTFSITVEQVSTGLVAVLPEGEQGISLFTDKANDVDKTRTLEFDFVPASTAIAYESIKWEVSEEHKEFIGIDDATGTITALKAGVAEVILSLLDANGDVAKFNNGADASLTYNITVYNAATALLPVYPEGKDHFVLYTNKPNGEDKTIQLEHIFAPENAYFDYAKERWTVYESEDDNERVSVDEKGFVTALTKTGAATVYLRLEDENGNLLSFDNGDKATTQFLLSIKQVIESITILAKDNGDFKLFAGSANDNTVKLEYTKFPEYSEGEVTSWVSSDPEVASIVVDERYGTATVTAHKAGFTTITATPTTGEPAEITIEVADLPPGMTLTSEADQTTLTLPDDPLALTAIMSPQQAGTFTWTPSVAGMVEIEESVQENQATALVKPLKNGVVTITATFTPEDTTVAPTSKDIELTIDMTHFVEKREGQNDLWHIYKADGLRAYATASRAYNAPVNDVILEDDIILEQVGATESNMSVIYPDLNDNKFYGVFDGNNKKISNLTLYKPENSNENAAFIGNLCNGGTIKNLTLENIKITSLSNSSDVIAGLVATTFAFYGYEGEKSSIQNCSVSGTITVTTNSFGQSIGGIAGNSEMSEYTNCDNSVNITYSQTDKYVPGSGVSLPDIGGVIAMAKEGVKITNCNNTGKIHVTNGCAKVGGILGSYFLNWDDPNKLEILNCNNSGEILGEGNYITAGGINGYANSRPGATISNCHNTANISTPDAEYYGISGGILGEVYSSTDLGLSDCTNSGNIRSWKAGGVIGRAQMSIKDQTISLPNCQNSGGIYKYADDGSSVYKGYLGDIIAELYSYNSSNSVVDITSCDGGNNTTDDSIKDVGYTYNISVTPQQ